MPRLTEDQRSELLKDYSLGISVFVIAKKYNVHFTYPSKAAKRFGLELRGNEPKSLTRASTRKWQAANPEKRFAHKEVERALLSGKLVKLSCAVCGTSEGVQAHHEDYSKPLDVKWLCDKDHKARHVELSYIKTSEQALF